MKSPFQCQGADTLSGNLGVQANTSVQVSVRQAECTPCASEHLHCCEGRRESGDTDIWFSRLSKGFE